MIRAIAIDDEPLPLVVLGNFCSQIAGIELLATFSNIQKASFFLSNNQVDLLFLDIQMPGMSGLDFYQKFGENKLVIFTTAFTEYAVEGFNLSAIDYLLKPFSKARFEQAVTKAIEYHNLKNPSDSNSRSIFIKADYKIYQVDLDEINYIEGFSDYLKIYRNTNKPIVTRMTLKGIMDVLPDSFFRVHKSYIVPLSKINSVRNRIITINDSEIPIGATYWTQFEEVFFK